MLSASFRIVVSSISHCRRRKIIAIEKGQDTPAHLSMAARSTITRITELQRTRYRSQRGRYCRLHYERLNTAQSAMASSQLPFKPHSMSCAYMRKEAIYADILTASRRSLRPSAPVSVQSGTSCVGRLQQSNFASLSNTYPHHPRCWR